MRPELVEGPEPATTRPAWVWPSRQPVRSAPSPSADAASPRQATEPQSSGARPDGRDPKLLSDAVHNLVQNKGWATEISVHTLLAQWGLLVGSTNAAHSRPEAYADSVLTIRTDSSAWATQLRLMAPQLVALLNDHLGDGTVTRIKILSPDAPSWKKGLRSVRDGRGPRDTYG